MMSPALIGSWLLLPLLSAVAVEPLSGTPGLENLIRVDDRLYSGSEPHGEEGFASLRKLGVRTVVSVDGLKPDLEAARAAGLEYVHIPVGYDGVATGAVAKLAAVMRTRPGPLYIHCHHGKHRGPAAAAIAWRCGTGSVVSVSAALDLLKAAGTDPKYEGLFASVRDFQPPGDAEIQQAAEALVPAVASENLAACMAGLDRHWERVKAAGKNGWAAPPDHPDVVPAREALMALEGMREAARLGKAAERPEAFRKHLEVCTQALERLETGLRSVPPDGTALESGQKAVSESCSACHRQFRD